jgi:hypothetical protein
MTITESIHRGATRAVIEAADILEVVDAALAGGCIDHRQISIILSEIGDAERALASLRMRIEKGGST